MENKLFKWCKKLIPGRSIKNNAKVQSCQASSDYPRKLHDNDFEYHSDMEQETPIPHKKLGIQDQKTDANTRHHKSLHELEHDDSETDVQQHGPSSSIFEVEFSHRKNSPMVHMDGTASEDLKSDGPDISLRTSVKSLYKSTEGITTMTMNLKEYKEDINTSNRTYAVITKDRNDILACKNCESVCCEGSESSMCLLLDFSEEEMLIIRNEVEIQLNTICPLSYYDFCVIACDVDYEDAQSFTVNLCKEHGLKGCMLFDPDIINLGGDIFEQYEAMIERSTKVFFYHTENYKKDHVHLRVQNGAVYQQLWEQMLRNREKCVPVFPHGRHKLGLALSGVSGLDPSIPDIFHHRLNATFTENIRNIRILKERDAVKKRAILYKELLKNIVQNHKKIAIKGQDLSSNLQRSEEQNFNLSGNIKPKLIAKEVKKEIHKAVSETALTNAVNSNEIFKKVPLNSYDISISKSSEIHIGPRIEVNVHVTTSENNSVCQDEDSDSVDECN